MKILKKGIGGALCLATAFALCGCGNDNPSDAIEKFTVSFDSQGGSAVESQQVEKGKLATRPEDPTKADNSFLGWYKESACENDFDFDTEAINEDKTLYAKWVDSNSSDVTKALFYWNYTGAPSEVYKEVVFTNGDRIKNKPADPTREGYEFDGWYTSTTYETAFSKSTKYTGNQTFYAKWLKVYTMEAEKTQLTGIEWTLELSGVVTENGDKMGSNFSGNVSGNHLIRQDENASGGAFVWGCMNLEDGYLDFEFTADKADDNAKLNIVVSAEFWGFKLTPDMFKVLVNPTSNSVPSVDYDTIDLSFVQTSNASTLHPTWINAYINKIQIKEGKNVIRLLVANSNANSVGTIKAQGPIVDCIVVKSASELTMKTYNN